MYLLPHFHLSPSRSPSLLSVNFFIKNFLFELVFSSPGCMSYSAERSSHYSPLPWDLCLSCLPIPGKGHRQILTYVADISVKVPLSFCRAHSGFHSLLLCGLWSITHISDTVTAVNKTKQHPLLVWAVDMSGWWSVCLKKLSRRLRQNPLGSQNELQGFSISCSEIISLLTAAVVHWAAHTFLIFPSPASKFPQEIIKRKMRLNGLRQISSPGGSPAFYPAPRCTSWRATQTTHTGVFQYLHLPHG